MAKFREHQRALELRRQYKSYSQIRQEVRVSKSTLSLWLKKFPLSKEQILMLQGRSEVRIEKYRQTMQNKREKRLTQYYKEAKKELLPLSKKELLLAGIFLYWGEGGKTSRNTVSINNTDPSVLKFSLFWMRKGLNIPKEKIQVFLHLYDDMVINDEINFWSKELSISSNQFAKPYIKKSKRTDIDQKGFGHGTCGLRVFNTVIKEKILMAIKGFSDLSQEKIKEL